MRYPEVSFKHEVKLRSEEYQSEVLKWFHERFRSNTRDFMVTTAVGLVKGGSMWDRYVMLIVLIADDALAVEFKLAFSDKMVED